MSIEQMKECVKTITLMEKDLMRDLTEEEKDVIINKGWETFLFDKEYLGFTEDDFKELKTLKAIISAFYTQDESVLEDLIKKAPDSIYFVLMDIADRFDGVKPCKCPNGKDSTEEFAQFMQDLYNDVPKAEKVWFNRLTDDIRKKVFEVYKENRNERQNVSDNILGGILTDAVKDFVIIDMVERLKKGEAIEMTHNEYLEVADYLCQHENRIFISNEDGTVRATIL